MRARFMNRERIKEVLRERDFRRLLGAQILGQAADGLAQATIVDILVLEPYEGHPGRIFALFAITLLPYSLVSPFLGVFVDRWARRSICVYSNLARGALLVAAFVWRPLLPSDNYLFVIALLLLGFGRLFLTTKGAMLPALLHEHHLLSGNAVSSAAGMIAALTGGVAGLGLGYLSPIATFVSAGFVYLAAGAVARRISGPFAHPHGAESNLLHELRRIASELGDGLTVLWGTPKARVPLIAIFLLRTVGMFVILSGISVIKEIFGKGERLGRLSASAVALGAAGVGGFAGAVTATPLGTRLGKGGLMVAGFVVSGASVAAVGGVISLPAIVVLMLVGGFGGLIAKIAVDAQVQEALPDDYRGRAFAVYDILYNAASVAAAGLILLLFEVSLRVQVVAVGLASLAVTLVLWRALRDAGIAFGRELPREQTS